MFGGGPSYPAVLISDVGRFRPYFTRRTVNRIVKDVRTAWADDPYIEATWEGETLELRERLDELWRRRRIKPTSAGLYPLFPAQDWHQWPRSWRPSTLTPRRIAALIRAPSRDKMPLLYHLTKVPARKLVGAIEFLDDDQRPLIVDVLRDRQNRDAADELDRLLGNEDSALRGVAAHAMAHRTDTSPARIAAALERESDGSATELMLVALGEMRYQKAELLIRRWVDSKEPFVREAALEALSKIKDWEHVAAQ